MASERPPVLELHVGAWAVDAGRHRGGDLVDAGRRIHSADEHRRLLPRAGPDGSKPQGVSKPGIPAPLLVPLGVRWDMPWLTLPTMPSASSLVSTRWAEADRASRADSSFHR